MLSHFGQAWISPMIRASRTFSRAPHVSQMTGNDSTLIVPIAPMARPI
jgi:hypothetical protein